MPHRERVWPITIVQSLREGVGIEGASHGLKLQTRHSPSPYRNAIAPTLTPSWASDWPSVFDSNVLMRGIPRTFALR